MTFSKYKKSGEKELPYFHCENLEEFIEALTSLSEVKSSLIEGTDTYKFFIQIIQFFLIFF